MKQGLLVRALTHPLLRLGDLRHFRFARLVRLDVGVLQSLRLSRKIAGCERGRAPAGILRSCFLLRHGSD